MYAESISDVIFFNLGRGHVKIKMAVRRHLENGTFELCFIVVDFISSERKHVLTYAHCLMIRTLMES